MPTTARFITLLLLSLALSAAPAGADDPHSQSAQAQELIKRGEYQQALDQLKSAYALFPYDQGLKRSLLQAYLEVAQRDFKLARYAEAADYFGQAHELAPEIGEIGLMRGAALCLDKQYDAARAELNQAGDGPLALFYLGKVSYETGDLTGALSLWRQALEKDPANDAIKSAIAKAERELPVESKMDKGYSSMFDLSFDAELPDGLAADVLDALESAYNTVCADFGYFPTTRVPVLLYTKSDYSQVTAGPDWSGGLYDGKIRLPVGGISRLTPQLKGVIFHEFTHVLVAALTRGNVPTWLNEGLAEVEGRKAFSHPTALLARAAQNDALIPLATLSGPFRSMSGVQALLAYEQSYSMANFLVSRYGWYAVQGILKSLGEGATIETAVSKTLGDWSLDLPGAMLEWRDSIK